MTNVEASDATPRRPFPVTILALVFLLLGLNFVGMAVQDVTWNEYKPGHPMETDLVPWAIGLAAAGATFVRHAVGLFGLRSWARTGSLLLGTAFLALAVYGFVDASPLLLILFTPGAIILLCLLYLARPSVRGCFH